MMQVAPPPAMLPPSMRNFQAPFDYSMANREGRHNISRHETPTANSMGSVKTSIRVSCGVAFGISTRGRKREASSQTLRPLTVSEAQRQHHHPLHTQTLGQQRQQRGFIQSRRGGHTGKHNATLRPSSVRWTEFSAYRVAKRRQEQAELLIHRMMEKQHNPYYQRDRERDVGWASSTSMQNPHAVAQARYEQERQRQYMWYQQQQQHAYFEYCQRMQRQPFTNGGQPPPNHMHRPVYMSPLSSPTSSRTPSSPCPLPLHPNTVSKQVHNSSPKKDDDHEDLKVPQSEEEKSVGRAKRKPKASKPPHPRDEDEDENAPELKSRKRRKKSQNEGRQSKSKLAGEVTEVTSASNAEQEWAVSLSNERRRVSRTRIANKGQGPNSKTHAGARKRSRQEHISQALENEKIPEICEAVTEKQRYASNATQDPEETLGPTTTVIWDRNRRMQVQINGGLEAVQACLRAFPEYEIYKKQDYAGASGADGRAIGGVMIQSDSSPRAMSVQPAIQSLRGRRRLNARHQGVRPPRTNAKGRKATNIPDPAHHDTPLLQLEDEDCDANDVNVVDSSADERQTVKRRGKKASAATHHVRRVSAQGRGGRKGPRVVIISREKTEQNASRSLRKRPSDHDRSLRSRSQPQSLAKRAPTILEPESDSSFVDFVSSEWSDDLSSDNDKELEARALSVLSHAATSGGLTSALLSGYHGKQSPQGPNNDDSFPCHTQNAHDNYRELQQSNNASTEPVKKRARVRIVTRRVSARSGDHSAAMSSSISNALEAALLYQTTNNNGQQKSVDNLPAPIEKEGEVMGQFSPKTHPLLSSKSATTPGTTSDLDSVLADASSKLEKAMPAPKEAAVDIKKSSSNEPAHTEKWETAGQNEFDCRTGPRTAQSAGSDVVVVAADEDAVIYAPARQHEGEARKCIDMIEARSEMLADDQTPSVDFEKDETNRPLANAMPAPERNTKGKKRRSFSRPATRTLRSNVLEEDDEYELSIDNTQVPAGDMANVGSVASSTPMENELSERPPSYKIDNKGGDVMSEKAHHKVSNEDLGVISARDEANAALDKDRKQPREAKEDEKINRVTKESAEKLTLRNTKTVALSDNETDIDGDFLIIASTRQAWR